MVSGYMCSLKSKRKVDKRLYGERKKNKRCVQCNSKLNRYSVLCDFCCLRKQIRALQKNQNRILKLLLDSKEKK